MKNSSSSAFFLVSFLYLFFLSSSVLVSAQKQECHPQDQKAIDQIKAAFGNNFNGDCCDREVFICDNDPPYRVNAMYVYNSNISGQIPAAIAELSSVTAIVFSNVSNLIGNIPPAITKLPKLDVLVITKTGISGRIPTFPVKNNFINLDLSNNSLTGSIPPGLSSWFPNLRSINLEKNKLTGTIPESFGEFHLEFISLSHNRLKGTIPKSLGKSDPYSINLSGNKFSGDASFLFGKNKTTMFMYLQRNNFTFDLSKLEMETDFFVLELSHNNLFGSLPQELTQMNLLGKFNVSYNNLCGQIPQGGRLQQYRIESYIHNKCLCGAPLPACV